ncbi:MAG: type I restriction-modification system subunit M [Candidatus Omnitrophica bacterium]|nr:type I restriction-modification system subunit M [Candidatus Omnitrophota bacterium]
MAIKKSELYSSLWKSCDELRGGMDASQYKDYVLVLLFIKYISDKYAGVTYAPITIPKGSSFKDMVALKGKATIGDDINKKIIAPIAEANKLSEMPDFNNAEKLGSGPDMVKKLSNLIAIFENPALDFSKNRAEGDDILGDAYEYLMKLFATESGKSKGQFYTPAEVSRIIAKTTGIASTTNKTPTVYDPACGSGSLLLKVADETEKNARLFGQEMDNATAGLARMNMILHDNATALIMRENTLSTPLFKDGSQLKTFDFVVANPPFSFKSWSNGVKDPDEFGRFKDFGTPPPKNGDHAFLLHIIRSLKTTGKGACILPHGVLFRGNAEAEIRTNIIRRGYIKGIIGLPPNLFYGTGIPACIIVLDKENADKRKGIFMIDAGKGFIKDGNKNRLRAQDIHKIVDVFNKQLGIPKYSRMVSVVEIEKNEFNLNIPRYIDSQEAEDIQDIEAHLKGDIPTQDIKDLQNYWSVYPALKASIFGESKRKGYSTLKITQEEIKHTIFSHPEFTKYAKTMEVTFATWKEKNTALLKKLTIGAKPKEIIHGISEEILAAFSKTELMDKYDIYQHLMEYWAETMQDDMYLIAVDGWRVELSIIKQTKRETMLDCDLISKKLLIKRYFSDEQEEIEELEQKNAELSEQLQILEDENSIEADLFSDCRGKSGKIGKGELNKRIKIIKNDPEFKEELNVLNEYIVFLEQESKAKKKIKEAKKALDAKVIAKYKILTESEIKVLVVDDKWMAILEGAIKGEMERISQRLTQRIKELAERYAIPLPTLVSDTEVLTSKVDAHLKKMGFIW